MTPEDTAAQLALLTRGFTSLDKDIQEQDKARKNDSRLISTLSVDVSKIREDVEEIKATQGNHGTKLDQILALLQARK